MGLLMDSILGKLTKSTKFHKDLPIIFYCPHISDRSEMRNLILLTYLAEVLGAVSNVLLENLFDGEILLRIGPLYTIAHLHIAFFRHQNVYQVFWYHQVPKYIRYHGMRVRHRLFTLWRGCFIWYVLSLIFTNLPLKIVRYRGGENSSERIKEKLLCLFAPPS